jgi:hypothetical protein
MATEVVSYDKCVSNCYKGTMVTIYIWYRKGKLRKWKDIHILERDHFKSQQNKNDPDDIKNRKLEKMLQSSNNTYTVAELETVDNAKLRIQEQQIQNKYRDTTLAQWRNWNGTLRSIKHAACHMTEIRASSTEMELFPITATERSTCQISRTVKWITDNVLQNWFNVSDKFASACSWDFSISLQ